MHAACCGTNTWQAVQGSATVFINNKPAVRLGDKTKHCGGSGQMIEGSDNVIVGGSSSGGSGGGGGGGSGGAGGSAGGGPTGTSPNGGAGNPTTSSGSSNGDAREATPAPNEQPPDEPQPILVAATWSKDRSPVSTSVSLSATCAEMAGTSAMFTIRDADDESKVIATLTASCGDNDVVATWSTPASGPPGRFVFTVTADGKEAASGILTLINTVEVKLILDEEPAAGVRVQLRADPSGETVSATANDDGIVRFEEAPFGDYTLFLEDEGS